MPISGYLICMAILFSAWMVRPAVKGMTANGLAVRKSTPQ